MALADALNKARQDALYRGVPRNVGPNTFIGQSTTATPLANVAFGGRPTSEASFRNIEELIQSRNPQAIGLIDQSTQEALRLSGLGSDAGIGALEPFFDPRALQERNALLGLSGREAQEQAIGNIPVSEFDKELQRRQRESLQRQAAAAGELGGGANIAEAAALGGRQQAETIQGRLAQLEPLVAAARGVSSTLSGIEEGRGLTLADILSQAATGKANIRLGSSAPLIQSAQNRAELTGLSAIQGANRNIGIANQLAKLIPSAVNAYQNYRVGQDLNASFDNNPGVF